MNVSIVQAHYGLKVITRSHDPRREVYPVDIAVYNCTFKDNIYDMLFSLRDPRSVRLMIRNTVFTSKETWKRSYAIRFHIPPLTKLNTSQAVIGLDNNTFEFRPSTNFALFFHGNKTLWIRQSTFRNCVCLYREKWKVLGSSSSDSYFYETAILAHYQLSQSLIHHQNPVVFYRIPETILTHCGRMTVTW